LEKHGEEVGVAGKRISEWIIGKQDGKMWTGCICLRKETSGGLLRTG